MENPEHVVQCSHPKGCDLSGVVCCPWDRSYSTVCPMLAQEQELEISDQPCLTELTGDANPQTWALHTASNYELCENYKIPFLPLFLTLGQYNPEGFPEIDKNATVTRIHDVHSMQSANHDATELQQSTEALHHHQNIVTVVKYYC